MADERVNDRAGGILGWVLAPSSPWKLAAVLTFPLLVILGVLVAMLVSWQQRSLEEIQQVGLREIGRTFYEHLKATRIWVTGHGGLYVEVPEHSMVGASVPDVNDLMILGKTYRRIGGEHVAPELMRIAEQRGLYTFHVTSLKPTTRQSGPDPWERKALRSFVEKGRKEATTIETRGDKRFFRYMAPLVLDASCVRCHQRAGFAEGSVRGGLSVDVPLTASDNEYARQVKNSAVRFGTLGAIAVAVVILITIFLSHRISEGFLAKLRQEAALRNLNELLSEITVRDKKILESIQDGIAVIDPRGVIEMVNDFLLSFDSFTERQVVGRRIHDLPRESILYRVLMLGDGHDDGVQGRCPRSDGSETLSDDDYRCWSGGAVGLKERECRTCPTYRSRVASLEEARELQIQEKIYTASSVFVTDAKTGEFYCELRVLHDATREKLSAILELAGAAAHNFRQPLAVILGLKDLIARKVGAGEPADQELAILEEQCLRLDDILKKMLHITTYRQKEYLDDLKIVDLDEAGSRQGPESAG